MALIPELRSYATVAEQQRDGAQTRAYRNLYNDQESVQRQLSHDSLRRIAQDWIKQHPQSKAQAGDTFAQLPERENPIDKQLKRKSEIEQSLRETELNTIPHPMPGDAGLNKLHADHVRRYAFNLVDYWHRLDANITSAHTDGSKALAEKLSASMAAEQVRVQSDLENFLEKLDAVATEKDFAPFQARELHSPAHDNRKVPSARDLSNLISNKILANAYGGRSVAVVGSTEQQSARFAEVVADPKTVSISAKGRGTLGSVWFPALLALGGISLIGLTYYVWRTSRKRQSKAQVVMAYPGSGQNPNQRAGNGNSPPNGNRVQGQGQGQGLGYPNYFNPGPAFLPSYKPVIVQPGSQTYGGGMALPQNSNSNQNAYA